MENKPVKPDQPPQSPGRTPYPGDKVLDTDGSVWIVSSVWAGALVLSKANKEKLIRSSEFDHLVESGPENWCWATKKELEIYRAEAEEQLTLFTEILKRSFLKAEEYLQKPGLPARVVRQLTNEKIKYVQRWATTFTKHEPDLEQAEAIATVVGNVLLAARAGSGKTLTLVYRVLFLLKQCKVRAHEVLVLAFNKNAATEVRRKVLAQLYPEAEDVVKMRLNEKKERAKGRTKFDLADAEKTVIDRVVNERQIEIPHVMTFHALAHRIVHPNEELLYDDSASGLTQGQSKAIQSIIDDHLLDQAFHDQIRELMLAHFREDWTRIVKGRYDQTRDEFLRFRRSLVSQSLNGEYVKSYGEKMIADFLFEHDLPYKYERNYRWNRVNYKPDFTIFRGERSLVIIEYFGMRGDPDYDEMSEAKRRFWKTLNKAEFLEYSPTEASRSDFSTHLKTDLESLDIPCNKLSEDEIWTRVRNRLVDRYSQATKNFISRCRKLLLEPEDLDARIGQHKVLSEIESKFYKLSLQIYEAYLRRLKAVGEDDFDGLIQRAVMAIATGNTTFESRFEAGDLKNLRHICIDEYQDFSKLFHSLLSAIRTANPAIQTFCVGDDWQAINGFAGSNLQYFREFENYFESSIRLNLSTNYRSCQEVVDVGNALMKGRGRPCQANSSELGTAKIAFIDSFEPTEVERETWNGDEITPILLRVTKNALDREMKVVFIARTHDVPYFVNIGQGQRTRGLSAFLAGIRSVFPPDLQAKIAISTAHSYKGLENQQVIVIDAIDRRYPLIHPDWIFARLFGDGLDELIDAERRLFYVALTRAINELVIITDRQRQSPFLVAIRNELDIDELNWTNYPPYIGEAKKLVVQIGNRDGFDYLPTRSIKDEIKACGYRWRSTKWPAWIKTVLREDFELVELKQEIWSVSANGIEVRISDDYDCELARFFVMDGIWSTLRNEL